ncbi:MAG TPA: DUF4190 domain-containing protein [Candidatus Absconditabacterales bacterium]|nr:DUF4190 domain-containing protein [Candidatus Absconditabacterales bacterium]
MTQVKNQKKGLAITSFVLSLVGLLLSLTVVGAIIGVPIAILGLIFGIVALVKKQKKGLAVTGVVISGLILLITSILAIFVVRNYDEIVVPVKEIAQMMKEDPELAVLMTNEQFAEEFQSRFQKVLIQKFGAANDGLSTGENLESLAVPTIMEEMKNVLYQLKDEYYQK